MAVLNDCALTAEAQISQDSIYDLNRDKYNSYLKKNLSGL